MTLQQYFFNNNHKAGISGRRFLLFSLYNLSGETNVNVIEKKRIGCIFNRKYYSRISKRFWFLKRRIPKSFWPNTRRIPKSFWLNTRRIPKSLYRSSGKCYKNGNLKSETRKALHPSPYQHKYLINKYLQAQ